MSGIGDATEQSEPPEVGVGGEALPPTLDRVVAEHGPLPEAVVRAMGVRLAEGLAAMHALGRVFGDLRPETVLMYPDGARLGTARPPADGTVGSAGDVYALAGVLVFAVTGRSPFRENGLEAVPAGLRAVLTGCLSDDPSGRPKAGELAATLADGPVSEQPVGGAPQPGGGQMTQNGPDSATAWIPPDPATTPIPPDAATTPVRPDHDPGQSNSSSRLPWIIAAACGLLVVVILAVVGVVAATRDDGDSTAGGGASTTGSAGAAPKYTAAGLGDACALLDMPAVEKVIGKQSGTPMGDMIELPSVADSLECSTMNEHGFILLHIEVSDQIDMVHKLWDMHRASGLGSTGSGVTAQAVTGLGEDAYLVVHEPNKGDSMQIGCMLGFLQSNVVAIVDVYLSEDDGSTREKLGALCRHQADTVLGRLK
ncbi:hypothetical protein [Nocardia huaxiensis]|uniref:hypothetical protein n=1 Tax=Nocardia huaxiensis TaxID=2755382 RepID=UPI001E571C3B|nr:hypothetical protein [Nocardia huaxiensis]UFS98390.1 hypothetical protein LPY97_11060 [Nocardia huaxiensis]